MNSSLILYPLFYALLLRPSLDIIDQFVKAEPAMNTPLSSKLVLYSLTRLCTNIHPPPLPPTDACTWINGSMKFFGESWWIKRDLGSHRQLSIEETWDLYLSNFGRLLELNHCTGRRNVAGDPWWWTCCSLSAQRVLWSYPRGYPNPNTVK